MVDPKKGRRIAKLVDWIRFLRFLDNANRNNLSVFEVEQVEDWLVDR